MEWDEGNSRSQFSIRNNQFGQEPDENLGLLDNDQLNSSGFDGILQDCVTRITNLMQI